MPRFEPFAGLRYDLSKVAIEDVTAPPYDVIGPAERDALAARSPVNVVEIDLPIGTDAYAEAAARLAQWTSAGTLVRDPPCLYAYRMSHEDELGVPRSTLGVFGAMELSRPEDGEILPHERTTPKAKSDRLDLLRATRTNTSAVWVLSPTAGLTDLLRTDDEPLASWWVADGVQHTVWRITDADRIAAVGAAVDAGPVLVADGHHRFETALAYQAERPSDDAGAGWMLTYVVELAEEQLTVGPIHRLLSGLDPEVDLRGALSPFFEVTPAGPPDAGLLRVMADQGVLTLVEPARTSFLRPRPGAFAPGGQDLDTVRLDAALATLPPHELRYQHGVDRVAEAVRSGDAQAGVLVRPATVTQILAIARGGDRMPPKTTFFTPKPATGIVLRSLD